jgi:hypothetical protein
MRCNSRGAEEASVEDRLCVLLDHTQQLARGVVSCLAGGHFGESICCAI